MNFNVDESVEVETDKEIELLRKKIMAVNNCLIWYFDEGFC